MQYRITLIILLVLGIQACQKDETIFVSSELLPYFEAFSDEAAARGVAFDYQSARIEGYLEDIQEEDVTGKCQFNSVDPNKIFVDSEFWRIASSMEKEFVVFHELGHCFLERTHLDSQDNEGSCLSMMHSGLTNCRNDYNISTRDDYLDELFAN